MDKHTSTNRKIAKILLSETNDFYQQLAQRIGKSPGESIYSPDLGIQVALLHMLFEISDQLEDLRKMRQDQEFIVRNTKDSLLKEDLRDVYIISPLQE